MRSFLKYWLPVLLWMILIFVGSTDLMSAEHTSRFLVPFLRWLAPDLSGEAVATIQLLIRKCAHVAEYAILAAFLLRAFSKSQERLSRATASAFIFAAIYAAFDEFHQSFVPSRTSSPYDVAIDTAGALAGLMVYRLMIRQVGQQSTIGNRKSK
jgi:VanZ family protein